MVKQAARLCPQLLSKIHDPVDLSEPIVVGLGADSLLYPVPEVIKLGGNWNPKVDKSKGTLHARCIVCPLVQFWRNTTIQFSGKVSLVPVLSSPNCPLYPLASYTGGSPGKWTSIQGGCWQCILPNNLATCCRTCYTHPYICSVIPEEKYFAIG